MDLNGIGLARFFAASGQSLLLLALNLPWPFTWMGYILLRRALFNLNNIDHVEVLKGPQGDRSLVATPLVVSFK